MRIGADYTGLESFVPGVLPWLPSQDNTVRTGRTPAETLAGEEARAFESARLVEWRQGLAQALEDYERRWAENAQERAYLNAGRKARQAGLFSNQKQSDDAVLVKTATVLPQEEYETYGPDGLLNGRDRQDFAAGEHTADTNESSAYRMRLASQAAEAYQRVSGAQLPVPYALGRGFSLAV